MQSVVASWLDKHNFSEGYDVYAAFSHDGGRHYEKDQKVEDALGANQPQWHAVSAMGPASHAVAAWGDQRDGNPDFRCSEASCSGWSVNDTREALMAKAPRATRPCCSISRATCIWCIWIGITV